MDAIAQEGIKIPNAVIVSGVAETTDDEDLTKFLEEHGTIVRSIKIDDPESEFHNDLVIEFDSGCALQSLEPMLPHTYQLTSDANVTCTIRSLASVYTQQLGGTATRTYLKGLREIATLSGVNFEAMLSQMLTEVSAAVLLTSTSSRAIDENPVNPFDKEPLECQASKGIDHPCQEGAQSAPIGASHVTDTTVLTSPTVLNPPGVQRLVVEHVVRSGEAVAQAHPPMRLRLFSGRKPQPLNEVDYDTWRSSLDLVLKDPTISDLYKSRKILDSLLSPAADIIKHLGPETSPLVYLQLLDSAFGTVEDGDELFAKFMNTLQNAGERPSAYLSRLQTALSIAVKRGGVSSNTADRHLLKQFCRGCWDDGLIADLRLAQKCENPPPFAQLLLMLRTEEDKQAAKTIRMKQHLGGTKQRASIHSQRTWVSEETDQAAASNVLSLANETKELKKQIATLQSQLAKLTLKDTVPKKPTLRTGGQKAPAVGKGTCQQSVVNTKSVRNDQADKPRPWYCFKCGEDGHIASSCDSEPNPKLVAEKRKLLREKQSQWEAQNKTTKSDLN